MKTISVTKAQQDLPSMMQQVLVGANPLIIEAQNGLQTVLLSLAQYQMLKAGAKGSDKDEPTVPSPKLTLARQQPVLGLGVGDIWMSDDFDEPLPDEFWTGGDNLYMQYAIRNTQYAIKKAYHYERRTHISQTTYTF